MTFKKCILTKNRCYIKNEKMDNGKPVGIVVHSTAVNNRYIKRYVQPDKNQEDYKTIIDDIGLNRYNNDWNNSSKSKCVHAFIGLNASNEVVTYQTLPFDICCWGVGSGTKGSYNYNPTAHIQFEICEGEINDTEYFNRCMKEAQELCAYLCTLYNLDVSSIVSHKECGALRYGSAHSDPEHWMLANGKDMAWFRGQVQTIINRQKEEATKYCVQVGAYDNEENANKMLEALKNFGFYGYITKKEK